MRIMELPLKERGHGSLFRNVVSGNFKLRNIVKCIASRRG